MAEVKVVQKRNNTTEITISGDLDIYCAMQVYQQHLQAVKIQQTLALKLANIVEIDTAGIQLLIVLIKAAWQQESHVHIASKSQSICDYSSTFQLEHYFNQTQPQES